MGVSAQGTKEEKEPEAAWQHQNLDNMNLEDAETAGKKEKGEKYHDGSVMHYSWLCKECVSRNTIIL